jgi:pimeloyl-ACP methyl ester carboxylesterase
VIRRRFFDLGDGQLHLRVANGAAGRPKVMALHQASGSSKALEHVIMAFSATRAVIAPDLPGNGDSSPLPMSGPAMCDYAEALLPLLDAETEPVDIYGFHAGASVAIELAIARPGKVRRVVLDSLGLYGRDEAEALIRDYVPGFKLDRHGTHLSQAWHVVRDTYLFWPWFKQDGAHARAVGVPEIRQLHDKVIEVLKSIDTYGDLYRAAFRHDKATRLPLVARPTLVTAGKSNSQHHHLTAVAKLLPAGEILETEGTYTPQSAQASVAAIVEWLDRKFT